MIKSLGYWRNLVAKAREKSVEKLKKKEDPLGWERWAAIGFLWLTEADHGSHRFAPDFAALPLRSAGRRFLVGKASRFLRRLPA